MSGEFPAVAATNQNVSSSAFAEALERAKQVSLETNVPISEIENTESSRHSLHVITIE